MPVARNTKRLLLGALTALCLAAAPAAEARIYWTDSVGGTVGRAALDGTSAESAFIPATSGRLGVAVGGGFVYWTNNETNRIGRARVDGTQADPDFLTADSPVGIAVRGGRVYWVNQGTDSIGRANLDGSGADPSFITGANDPFGLAVDARYVYWSNANKTIGRATVAGSEVNQAYIAGGQPRALAVTAAHLYWTNNGINTIGRTPLGDTGARVQNFITGANRPIGIAVDARHLYWSNADGNSIGRSALDGTGVDHSFLAADSPGGIALDPPVAPSAPVRPVSAVVRGAAAPPKARFGSNARVSLRLVAGRISPRSSVAVRVTNRNAFAITGTVSDDSRRRAKLRTRAFSLGARSAKTLKLSLPRALRRALRRRGRISLRLSAVVEDPSGAAVAIGETLRPKLKRGR